ncbi:MAG: L-threonylcarbamoyladenylate synthase [Leptolyngbyaceae cyanobacterium CSU_1_3]|nr:L-threonylcarbamoyladenylate synthase [Leptolyngbyaceae cyanobacterium CSU_1_3]
MPQVSLDEFVEGVVSGQRLGSFLTDTVPALAAKPDRADLIFRAKQRSLDKPLILMAAAIEDLWPYVAGSRVERQIWQQIAECYWPGALTLVLPASSIVPSVLNPTDPSTIGVRVPNHAIAQSILQRTGPLATTSANRSGQPALQTLAEIAAEFPDALTLASSETLPLGSGQSASGQPSTVAKWTDCQWQILRQGAIKLTNMGV